VPDFSVRKRDISINTFLLLIDIFYNRFNSIEHIFIVTDTNIFVIHVT